ncbi:hypothetical protein FHR84_000825 [Actinopolyspora biskrensis]|uniref:TauD/TfdA-like domain-containing protein n=1 Tax=Actinopolyspora biskrensis TaxID=1470178 RepID=A0A852YS13_9ACTN|nr:TauD/TfdA family dioxygenase [Actinopolyspora biskrensis]NYH77511.1 hypothetical protein [Actinopolyspora biskrensis]
MKRTIPTIDAGITSDKARRAASIAASTRRQNVSPGSTLEGLPLFSELKERVVAQLSSDMPICVLRGTGYLDVGGEDRKPYLAELAALLGYVSDSNVVDERSGTFVDEVRPSDPGSKDVTFQLGACEAHADESSKLVPEDVVGLWCARPAAEGGSNLVWLTGDLVENIAAQPNGPELVETLRQPDFMFGGKLRQPPKVVRAPIFFGQDGVRFRLGSLQDAIEVTERPLSEKQEAALKALISATQTATPLEYNLDAGEALVWMNRKALHSRTDFDDRSRLLYRTRCFNDALSNTRDDRSEWLTL